MRFRHILLLVVLMLCCSSVSADIRLKKRFFGSWAYSINGMRFEKVGFSGSGLSSAMWANERALLQLEKYKTFNTLSLVAAFPGGFLIGWPIGGYIGNGGEWQHSWTTMIIIGVPLSVASIVFQNIATRKLKNAVDIYNDDEESLSFNIELSPIKSGQPTTVLFRLKYGF